jgi:two-component system osmolarity sensor histidine kinase EnvZ
MRIMPRSFLARTILMVLIPLIVALSIVTNAFFGNHWKRVHATLARTLAGEITTLVNFLDKEDTKAAQELAKGIGINVSINETLKRPKHNDNNDREAGQLAESLHSKLKKPANIYIDRGKRLIFIDIPVQDGKTATFGTSMHRIYSTSTEVFLIWILGSMLIV